MRFQERDRLKIFTFVDQHLGQMSRCGGLEQAIAKAPGNTQGFPAEVQSSVQSTTIKALECHQAHGTREPAAVTKASGERLRRMKVTVYTFPVGGRHEDVPKVKMDVYGQFVPLLRLGKML